MALHVEDELVAVDRRARELEIEGGFGWNLVETAARAAARVRRVHGQQRRRRAACGDEEGSPGKRQAPRVAVARSKAR
jgi:hypothetical protein